MAPMWRAMLLEVMKRNLASGGDLEEAVLVAKTLLADRSPNAAHVFLEDLGLEYQDIEEVLAQFNPWEEAQHGLRRPRLQDQEGPERGTGLR